VHPSLAPHGRVNEIPLDALIPAYLSKSCAPVHWMLAHFLAQTAPDVRTQPSLEHSLNRFAPGQIREAIGARFV
jgi:hypothetical protein